MNDLHTVDISLEHLASGRRIINLCLFSWFASRAYLYGQTPWDSLFFLCVTIAAAFGMFRISQGLHLSRISKALTVVGSCVPGLGLLVIVWFSSRASKALRSAGYKVGMFLASKAHVA
jgi:hypothetical protein